MIGEDEILIRSPCLPSGLLNIGARPFYSPYSKTGNGKYMTQIWTIREKTWTFFLARGIMVNTYWSQMRRPLIDQLIFRNLELTREQPINTQFGISLFIYWCTLGMYL